MNHKFIKKENKHAYSRMCNSVYIDGRHHKVDAITVTVMVTASVPEEKKCYSLVCTFELAPRVSYETLASSCVPSTLRYHQID